MKKKEKKVENPQGQYRLVRPVNYFCFSLLLTALSSFFFYLSALYLSLSLTSNFYSSSSRILAWNDRVFVSSSLKIVLPKFSKPRLRKEHHACTWESRAFPREATGWIDTAVDVVPTKLLTPDPGLLQNSEDVTRFRVFWPSFARLLMI